MKKLLFVASVGILAGACTYSEAKYEDDLAEAACKIFGPDCLSVYATEDECLNADTSGGVDTSDCIYDAAAAKECVDAWKSMSCPADLASLEIPSVCADVYECTADTDTDTDTDTD